MSNVLDYGVNGGFGSSVGGLGTTVKYFPRPLGPSIGVAPSTPSASSAAGALFLPAQNVFNGQQFNVLASGNLTDASGDPSSTVTIVLYGVTGTAAAPVYTALTANLVVTPSYANEPWAISAQLIGSSNNGANGLLIGSYEVVKNAAITAPTTVTNVVTGLDFNAGNPALQQGAVMGFVVGVTFGTTFAGNIARLFEFTIES